MKILVIGSKGFIGSHLVKFFTEKGYETWQCDVVVDYVQPNYFLVDATNANFQEIFEVEQFNVCVNCSGAASVPDSIVHPLRDYTLNTSNVFNILNAINKHNPRCKFINLSSAAVYGNPSELPIKENAEVNPISPYGKHKLMSEMICDEFYQVFGVKTCSVRIFSAYGNGLRKQLFWDLHKKLLGTDSISLFGSGNETRDFIHVDDIVQVIELIIENSKFEGDVINVANGEEVSVKDAVNKFVGELGWSGEITFTGNERVGDPNNWCADISKIKGMGYKQTVTLSNGLNKYIKWLKENN